MMLWEQTTNSITNLMVLITIYSFTKTHIMNNLIIIEFTVISLLMLMFVVISTMKMELYLILYFMIITICESIVGLSLLIAMIRTHSNDFIKSTNIMKF